MPKYKRCLLDIHNVQKTIQNVCNIQKTSLRHPKTCKKRFLKRVLCFMVMVSLLNKHKAFPTTFSNIKNDVLNTFFTDVLETLLTWIESGSMHAVTNKVSEKENLT